MIFYKTINNLNPYSGSGGNLTHCLFLELHDKKELRVRDLAVLVHVELVDGGLGLVSLGAGHPGRDHLQHLLLGDEPAVVQVQLGEPLAELTLEIQILIRINIQESILCMSVRPFFML